MDKDHWLKQLNVDVRTLLELIYARVKSQSYLKEAKEPQNSLLCYRFIYKILFTVYNYLEL